MKVEHLVKNVYADISFDVRLRYDEMIYSSYLKLLLLTPRQVRKPKINYKRQNSEEIKN
jgi:hypothetical protein